MITVQLVQRAPYDRDPAFPLAEGPLSPIDPATFVVPMPRVGLVDVVGGDVGGTAGYHAALDAAEQAITTTGDPTAFQNAAAASLDPAAGAHAANSGAFEAADPVSVIVTSGGVSAAAGARRGEYQDEPPPELPENHPGPPPGGGDAGPPLI